MRKTPTENIDTALCGNALMQFIGADNVKRIQEGFADLLLKQVESDLSHFGYYIFYPPDQQEIIEDAFNKVSKKIQKMYEGAMLEVAQRSVEKWKELAMTDVKKISEGSKANED